MIDQLLKLVKENAGDAIINNPKVPNQKNDLAINTMASSIFDNLKGQVSLGNLGSLMDMLKGGGDLSSNALVKKISAGVIGDLMAKVGLNKAAATGIVNKILPLIMNQLKHKANDPKDSSLGLDDIIGALGGGKGGGDILGKLKGLFG